MSDSVAHDAIVLTGGTARRLGGVSKADLDVAGRSLLDRALDAVPDARRVVVVGPPSERHPHEWTTVENPPGGGPVAGIAAGLELLGPDAAPWVVTLACDIPRASQLVPLLLSSVGPDVDGAVVVDADGRAQYLLAIHRTSSLRSALASLETAAGASVRSVVAGLTLTEVPDREGLAQDVDTWDDVERIRREWR